MDTALIGAFVAQHSHINTAFNHGGVRDATALSLLGLGAIALAASVLYLLRALQPRLDHQQPTRFAFPWVADANLADLMAGNHQTIRREAWIEARALSRIVRAKYQNLRKALPCAAVAGALLITWLIVAPAA